MGLGSGPGTIRQLMNALRRAAAAVLAYGKEHNIQSLTTRKISCDESDCWEFTALAAKLDERKAPTEGRLAAPTYS